MIIEMRPIIQKIWVVMVMLCLSIPAASAYDFEIDGIYYNITSMSNLEVGVTYKALTYVHGNSYRNSSYRGEIVIPSTVNYNNRTYTVTSIEYSAFGTGHIEAYGSHYDNYGCKITSIHLPSTIKRIEDYAFQNCQELAHITIPGNVETIGNRAFWSSNITSIRIPDSTKKIGERCFCECKQLKYVIVGNSLSRIGDGAFTGCSSLLEFFCTSSVLAVGLSPQSFTGSHSALEVYVPSVAEYGFGKEYVSFPLTSFLYSGTTYNIEWANNLKAYKCEISESECKTEIDAGTYTQNLKATYSNGVDFTVEIPYTIVR